MGNKPRTRQQMFARYIAKAIEFLLGGQKERGLRDMLQCLANFYSLGDSFRGQLISRLREVADNLEKQEKKS